jgi:AraC-like DNA-binding protein
MEKVFDSEDLPQADRVDAWRAVVSHSLTRNEFSIERAADFRASLRAMDLGVAQVTAMTYSSLLLQRTPKLIRQSDPELYSVALTLRGRHGIAQAGRTTVCGVRDLVVFSSSKPFETQVVAGEGTAASVMAQIPRALLPLPRDMADHVLAVRLSGHEGIGALLAHFLTHLVGNTGSYRPTDGPRLGTVLLDLFTAMLAHHLEADTSIPPESRQRTLLLRIQAFIQQHLGDPQLSPGTIAAAHHISIRYLHRLFQDHGHTVSAWIRRQRLERCRRDLSDPALHQTPIHKLATRWGFTQPAAFSRTFHAAYGLPPREYRHHALGYGGAQRQ